MLNKKLFKWKKEKTFLSKLYDILNNTTYKEIIYWNKEGKGIIIANVNEFSLWYFLNIIITKIINESKKEIEKLEKQNRNFYDKLQLYKNGSNIILKI